MSDNPVTRRRLLQGGAVLVGGATLGGAAVAVAGSRDPAAADETTGSQSIPFHGAHQAGVETPVQAHTWFVGLDLRPDVDAEALRRLMVLWTDDAARLTRGIAPLADQEKELATDPSRLTVTVGYGATLFDKVGLASQRPPSLAPLPPFSVDRLDPRWGEADLLLQIGSDDVSSISHAARVLMREADSFATVRWVQRGFTRARGAAPAGATGRNALGQVDGTVNPTPGTEDFARVVWAQSGPAWWHGGTMLVLRRIRLELDPWEQIGRTDREQILGRRLADGAPITGGEEKTAVDLDAVDESGLPVVPEFAHVRQARARNEAERFLRRGFNFDDSPGTASVSEAGLLFAAYMADVDRQFVPVQRRLAELDLLNTWTTPIGSAVFAILPGCAEGEILGASLLG